MTSEERLVKFVRDRANDIINSMNREGNISFETKDELEKCFDNLYDSLYDLYING